MAEELRNHPIMTYLTFVLPMALLVIGVATGASVFLLMITIAWLGVAFMILFLPAEGENGSSS